MVNKKQKEQMKDYLVSRLKMAGSFVVPMSKEFVGGINSNYIIVEGKGIVLLIDGVYPKQALDRVYYRVKSETPNLATVLLKDGKTFFRNAAEGKYFKKSNQLSLKDYSNEDMHRMILVRPEEAFGLIFNSSVE
mgnify:CR=1 FL=1